MSNVCAVVVTYNRLELLKECINALDKQTYQCDVLIVDNCSTDGTFKFLEDNYTDNKKIIFFQTESNIGGAGGFNLGMKKAVEQGYDYIWIMDDDCLCEENTLEELVKADSELNGEYGYLSSVVLWKDDTECIMNRQKVSKNYYQDLKLLEKGIIKIDQSTFVSLFIKKETIAKYGLPIKEFFIWGDDIEYTRRINIRNKQNSYMVGRSKVHHHTEKNVGSNIALDDENKIDRYIYAFRNEAFLYRKEGIAMVLYYLAKRGRDFFRILLYKKPNKTRRITILLNGILKGLVFNPPIEYMDF